jgi:hypothetical protein
MAAMWGRLFRDPAPQHLIKQHAPRVGRWVERMSTREPYEHEYTRSGDEGAELFPDDGIPNTLAAMMRFVAEEWLPEIVAHDAFANEWLAVRPDLVAGTNGQDDPASRAIGSAEFAWRGMQIATWVMPYRFWVMQHLHDDLAACDEHAQARVRSAFRDVGLESLLDLRTLRRVGRVDHLEVWGALVDEAATVA